MQERTCTTLLRAGVQLEEHGGDVQAVAISAKTGANVSRLVEAVMAQVWG